MMVEQETFYSFYRLNNSGKDEKTANWDVSIFGELTAKILQKINCKNSRCKNNMCCKNRLYTQSSIHVNT